ncbi:MAG: tetratricopeptide repeat protein [Opitutales bacterium]|nr:tetratricopeptide repeat protein [Opitutales bacterium]
MNKIITWVFLLSYSIFLLSCGGDEKAPVQETTPKKVSVSKPDSVVAEADEPNDMGLPEPSKAEVKIPDPNGVYLPSGESKNGKPVYANADGFTMWFNGSAWRITDRTGGGNLIASGKADLNEEWSKGGEVRHYPDDQYAKDALFRLAVAYQGSQDNKNAARLFKQFIQEYPEDKNVAASYLSLGDIVLSQVKPDEQPTFEQFSEARKNYALVRASTQDIALTSDATFNEGGVLERAAENPEGLINYYFTFDKNKNDALSSGEFNAIGLKGAKAFSEYDLNGDKSLDFGEIAELAIMFSYAELENLYRMYNEKFASTAGARISEATQKIGFACEKQGRPSEMLTMYFEDIKKFGNDPSRVGVDGILAKYTEKYNEYETLYGKTLDLLEKIQNPDEVISFTFRNRKGIEDTISGTVKEILNDRRKLLPYLASEYKGMDQSIYREVAKLKGAIYVNPKYTSKFKGYHTKYKKLNDSFPTDLSPAKAYARLLDEAIEAGTKTLELRMRAGLASVGSKAGGSYNPERRDFPAASPGVLVWMAKTMLAQNSTEDAMAAMDQLLQIYGSNGGDFLFDANFILGQANEKNRDHQAAAVSYENALTNSSWHPLANTARMRLGSSLFEVASSSRDSTTFEKAISNFKEVRADTDASLDERAESAFMMGECKRAQKDYAGAAFLFLETTLNFAGSLKWAPKSYEKAITSYEQAGASDQVSRVEKQYMDWQRKFLK